MRLALKVATMRCRHHRNNFLERLARLENPTGNLDINLQSLLADLEGERAHYRNKTLKLDMFPSKEEQQAIVSILQDIESFIDMVERHELPSKVVIRPTAKLALPPQFGERILLLVLRT
jgi:hypothetical protein